MHIFATFLLLTHISPFWRIYEPTTTIKNISVAKNNQAGSNSPAWFSLSTPFSRVEKILPLLAAPESFAQKKRQDMWQNGHSSLAFFLKNQVGKGHATLWGKAYFLAIRGWRWFQALSAPPLTDRNAPWSSTNDKNRWLSAYLILQIANFVMKYQ